MESGCYVWLSYVFFPLLSRLRSQSRKQCPPLGQGELRDRVKWKEPGGRLEFHPARLRRLLLLWSLASSLIELRCFLRPRPTDPNGSKLLTQPLSLGLTCMTNSLVFHALDGFTSLMCLNAEFEVLPKILIRTMRFIPVRVSGVSLLSQAWWWSC